MSLQGLKGIAVAMVLAASLGAAHAADELVVHAYEDGAAGTGLEVVVDGEQSERLDGTGSATFDLAGGRHTVEVLLGGVPVHRFNFTSADGQLVDVTVMLATGEDPKHFVESYFATESARDRASAPTGTYRGRVELDGSALSGAVVTITETGDVVEADAGGNFSVTLPRGLYTLNVTHPQLDASRTENVRVVSGITKQVRYAYGTAGAETAGDVEEVLVLGSFDPTAFGESERFSVNVIETLGIEQLARFGDSDVAASVVRVPSVTVQSGKFVFIRGLGGRYITTSLNGATLPSTDPTKRTVPLDLFPSNIVKQLDIKKSALASMPGESTGGNLVINTRSFPEDASGKLSVSLGYTSGLTGETVDSDPANGSFDFLGFDDGTRDVPPGVSGIAALLSCEVCQSEISSSQRQQLSQIAALQLTDNLELDSTSTTPNVSLGANYGDLLNFRGNDVGFFVAGNYRNGWSQRESGISRTFTTTRDIADDLTFEETTNTVDASGLVALGINVGDSSYQANTLVSRVTDSKVRVAQGLSNDEGAQTYRYSIDWEERQFLSQQFTGEHVLGGGLSANWQVTASNARRYAPDRREVRFDIRGGDGVFDLLIANLSRTYEDLSDDNVDSSFDFDYLFDTPLGDATAEFGAQLIQRERDSDSEVYGFAGNQSEFDSNAPNRRVSDVINPDTITGDGNTGITFANLTTPADSYTAELDLNSVYGMYSQRFASVWQGIIGLRYEDYEQITDTFSVFGAGGPVQSRIDDDIVLPSFTLNWEATESQQVRFAASRTVSRPDFKETANSTFTDDEFDFRVRGNPFLTVSEITNLDLRWEMYWSDTESVSVALFQKTIDDPIERVLLPASGTAGNSRTYDNGEEADLTGIEFDGRRDFEFNDSGSRTLFVAVNASLIDSEIQLDSGDTRRLQGQPDYTFNLVAGYDDVVGGIRHELTALLNQSGETIVDVGTAGLEDIIEEPRTSVDVNYKGFLTQSLTLKAKVGNLLNDEVEFTQGGRTFQRYEKGVTLQAGLDWNF